MSSIHTRPKFGQTGNYAQILQKLSASSAHSCKEKGTTTDNNNNLISLLQSVPNDTNQTITEMGEEEDLEDADSPDKDEDEVVVMVPTGVVTT